MRFSCRVPPIPGMPKIIFLSDKVKVNGPRVDNSYSVSFDVGEYEKSKLADLLLLDPGQVLKVSVETE